MGKFPPVNGNIGVPYTYYIWRITYGATLGTLQYQKDNLWMDVKMRRWGKSLTVFHRKADDMIWINFAMNWEAVEYILQKNWNFPKNGRPTPCSMLQATIGDKLRVW